MPISVGIDLLAPDDVQESLRLHGERYLKRVYTDGELRDCGSSPERLAARFAAKEATMKVLGPVEEPVPWSSIEITRDLSGRPSLALGGEADSLARQRGVSRLAVSLAHERNVVAAIVLAEMDELEDRRQ